MGMSTKAIEIAANCEMAFEVDFEDGAGPEPFNLAEFAEVEDPRPILRGVRRITALKVGEVDRSATGYPVRRIA